MNVMDTQLVVFENGIGFLCVLFSVNESSVYRIYDFANPGYLIDKHKELQFDFISELREMVLDKTSFDIYVEGDSKKLAIKESYLFNAAFTDYRFDNLKDLGKTTSNVHKHIAIEYDFEDKSEVDYYCFIWADIHYCICTTNCRLSYAGKSYHTTMDRNIRHRGYFKVCCICCFIW